ncbi:MAG: riboflavin biosynthesis protein RibF [Oscillospiraceae bacterium]|nr:riboflavin biosynthesis protein RibF [Oscillospiraceae bacterium]
MRNLKIYTLKKGGCTIPKRPRAVALGIFDGVHIGHRAVILNAVGVELKNGEYIAPSVLTFCQSPSELPKDGARELLTLNQKTAALATLGVEEWIQADFEQLREFSPERFVNEILHHVLDARRVCCGFNYRFGKDASGNADTLKELCRPLGIEVVVANPVLVDDEPVSASRIRRLVENGEMEKAARLMGRPFTLDLEVVCGQRLGRLLGSPTLNQPMPQNFVHPRFGVYISSIEVDGRVMHGVTNIGIRPTVGSNTPLAETWIADYDGDLYGRRVPVSLIKFLRSEKKFESVDDLKKQIFYDAEQAKQAVFGTPDNSIRAVLFDFDDTLQERRRAFLKYCDFFFKKYFPDLPQQEIEARKVDMLLRNKGGYVNYIDFFTSLFQDWGWEDAPPVGDIYHEFQLRFPEFVSLFPETVQVLTEVKRRGYLVGVITNGTSLMQNRKLDVSGLRPFLDIAVVSGDEMVHKPDAEIFRRAAARLGVACQNCIYVGDHPVNDIQGALGAGMRAVYINAYGSDVHPEDAPEIGNLNELLELLPKL